MVNWVQKNLAWKTIPVQQEYNNQVSGHQTGRKNYNFAVISRNKKGKEFKMSYYQAPEEALEKGEEMSSWAAKAYSAALRAASKKQKK